MKIFEHYGWLYRGEVDVEKGVLRGGLGGVIGNYGWGRLSGGRIESVGNL